MQIVPAQAEKQESPTTVPCVGSINALHDSCYAKAGVRIVGFGRYYPNAKGKQQEQDWSLRTLRLAHPERSSIVRYFPNIISTLGIREALAPSPLQFNGLACDRADLNVAIPIGSATLWRGADADICPLEPGQAFIASVGGCAGGWMSYPGIDGQRRTAAAHLGFKSILRNVIPNMAAAIGVGQIHLKQVHAGYAFPIDPYTYHHRWNHPRYGAQNKKICEEMVERYGEQAVLGWDNPKERKLGRIDLGFIIRSEYKALGIPTENLHGTPTYDSFLGHDKKPLWYTTRGPYRKRRNLMIIHRFQ